MQNVFLTTKRLLLKRMSHDDFDDLAQMLKNPRVMYAWEHTFTDKEVSEWIEKNLNYYEEYGYAYFLAYDKKLDKVIGQIALLQDCVKGKNYIEVGYILKQEFWGLGYAKEGVKALIDYAFSHLNAPEVIAEIRPMNIWSINVAKDLGMELIDEFEKNVRGKMLLHKIYSLKNPRLTA